MYSGPHIKRDGLVFGYDTGYGIADNNTATRFYPGKSTTNRASEFTDPSLQSLANGVNPSTAIQLGSGRTCEIVTFQGEKALKVNRGSSNGTYSQNRIYWSRSANAGNYWSWSALVYSTTPGPSIALEAYGGGYTWGIGQVKSSSHSGNGWERLFVRSSSPLTGNTTTYNFIYANTDADFYVKDIQFEYNQYPTPFTTGTRTSTTSLIDLTKTTDIDVSNVSFDSTGQPTFDGTDDSIVLADPGVSSSTGFSIELVIKPGNASTSPMVIVPLSGGIDHYVRFNGDSTLYLRMIPAADSSVQDFVTSSTLSSSNYHHVIFTFKQSEGGKAYYNGTLENSSTANFTALDWTSTWRVGQRGNNTRFYQGELPVLKVYNRALSATEAEQNFRAYKNRFDI